MLRYILPLIFVASQIWYREDGSKRRETLYEDGRKISDEEY